MRSHTLARLNQVGDTIVEVMVVLAILGSAIGISYATANRSLLNVRQAEESSEGDTLAQEQIEALRSFVQYTSTGPESSNDIFNQSSNFCIDNTQNDVVDISATSATLFSEYVSPHDDPCTYTNGIKYYIADSYSSVNSTFEVQVAWYDVLGQGIDTATLYYNLYQ